MTMYGQKKYKNNSTRSTHALIIAYIALALAILGLFSCGPCKEEIEAKKAKANARYEIGSVVYLKPDSCSALIMGTDVSFDYNGVTDYNSGYTVYRVRDCHGIEAITQDQFIYGLKHR